MRRAHLFSVSRSFPVAGLYRGPATCAATACADRNPPAEIKHRRRRGCGTPERVTGDAPAKGTCSSGESAIGVKSIVRATCSRADMRQSPIGRGGANTSYGVRGRGGGWVGAVTFSEPGPGPKLPGSR